MSGFGFLSPLLLGFSALAVPIFLLYMLRLRRTDMNISSTFLWQQLVRDREANAPWQRLRPNLLMLLQLLILLALVLALARPFQEVETITKGRTVVLIDASASMNATDVDGQTRFDAAKDLALDSLDTLGADDTMTIIRVAEVPEVLAAASRDKRVLRNAIESAEPSGGSADWEAAMTIAAAGARGVDTLSVVILGDGGLVGNLPDIPGEIRYEKIGEDSNNVAISALSTRSLPNSPPQLFTQITNFGAEDTRVIFEIQLDDQLYSSEFYDVAANTTEDIIIENLPEDFSHLEARISKPSSVSVADHLAIDNVAYAVNTEARTGGVLLMTEGNTFLENIFNSISGVELTIGDPQRGLRSGEFDLVVLDSWIPTGEMPSTDILIVNPVSSTDFFVLNGESIESTIDPVTGGTLPEDERTRFVNFSDVFIRKFQTLGGIDWATPLVETEAGEPLILAGEFEGQQIAIITFALSDSNLPLNIAWPILVSSLMEWYRPQSAISVNSLAPSDTLTIRPTVEADRVIVTRPDGNEITVNLNESLEGVFADTKQLGFYEIDIQFEGESVQQETFAINLFDENESFIAPAEEVRIQTNEGETIISSQTEEIGRRDLWEYLVAIGLLILGFEWWYYHRSLNRKPKAASFDILSGNQKTQQKRWWQTIGR